MIMFEKTHMIASNRFVNIIYSIDKKKTITLVKNLTLTKKFVLQIYKFSIKKVYFQQEMELPNIKINSNVLILKYYEITMNCLIILHKFMLGI